MPLISKSLFFFLLSASAALVHSSFVITASLEALSAQQQPCLEYRGTYGGFTIHALNNNYECFGTPETTAPGAVIVPRNGRQLVVIERVALESDNYPALAEQKWHELVLSLLHPTSARHDTVAQLPLDPNDSAIDIVAQEPGRIILSMDPREVPELVTRVPAETEVIPVPEERVKPADRLPPDHPILQILKELAYDEKVDTIVSTVDLKQLEEDVTYLSGEREDSPLQERTATSKDAIIAARWIEAKFYDYGCDTTTLYRFRKGFSPNVICTFWGKKYPKEHVILGAHYDSRGSLWGSRAPGADDDGSGTTMLLQSASLIARHNLVFDRTVQIIAFSGEEQGLFGSRAYARRLRNEGVDVTVMLQGDMLAYHKEGEPMQCGFPERYHTEEVTQLVSNVTALYAPELVTGVTRACCSDHQSFWENGFPSTQFFERNGPIADPMYHNSGDLVYRPGYDLQQLAAITKAMFASILHVAGFAVEWELV
ncbi:Zn-dependent exopeptidase [Endogone sp. FLAS-F59071]|nr:Zn-dependent exopeptidase [Endogone sp. FLAS-F59071]|eukprot:RUS20131.1 Zn-dependent exopeptidase [Endogone sp. FLAS-F59071]